ncbi:MAG: hypothetical protein V7L27_17090 [Nostoc sp.]|uniref:hypothetical protein n=1 Tax=Nostoc sp. TaxID=1180 RepID=UPI002FF66996
MKWYYAALTAVAHGGNPLQPFGHPTAGASLSLWEKTTLLHQAIADNLSFLKSKISIFYFNKTHNSLDKNNKKVALFFCDRYSI